MPRPFTRKRRQFLSLAAVATAGLGLPAVLRAQHVHGAASHGAPGAAGHPADGSLGNAAEATGLYSRHDYNGSPGLAAGDALPSGEDLPRLPLLENTSGHAAGFTARLTAQPLHVELLPGHPTDTAWAYNGSLPGPLLEMREGQQVDIAFHNRLPQASTIHWHGIATPPDEDGNPPDIVAPGATRHYRYMLPPGSAGTYWYHPHPHLQTGEQVYRGLAGPLIVRAGDDPLAHLPEQHLFITDLRLGDDGHIPPNTRGDWNLNGRYGQFVLVNGALRPHIHADGSQRWRIWNACNARPLRLSLGGHPFTLVGTDGGLLGAPVENLRDILLAPAERIEIVVHPGPHARPTLLLAEPYTSRGEIRGQTATPHVLASVDFAAGAVTRPVPAQLRPIAPLLDPTAHHTIVFSEIVDSVAAQADRRASPEGGIYTPPPGRRHVINGKAYDMARIDVEAKLGEVEEWQIINVSSMTMDHVFHIHGTQFQVVERTFNGRVRPEPFLAWRDTVNLRPGESVRLRMVQAFEGLRMFHCHILEHEDMGMMGNVMVRR